MPRSSRNTTTTTTTSTTTNTSLDVNSLIHDTTICKLSLTITRTQIAYLKYSVQENVLDVYHTYVPSKQRGKGYAAYLVQALLKYVYQQKSQLKVKPTCTYVAQWFEKHLSKNESNTEKPYLDCNWIKSILY